MPETQEIKTQETSPKPVRDTKTVVFDKSLGADKSFEVEFSERGFLVGDTRLSFEYLEDTLSKSITLTLKNGRVLDPISQQKILKYKFLFPKPSTQKKAEETAKSAPAPQPASAIAEVIDEAVNRTRQNLMEEKVKILKFLSK